VPLTKKEGAPYVAATPDNAVSGEYPLSRYLYVYINKAPNKPLAPLEREFIKLVMSQQGQQVVVKDGYIPLPAKVIEKYMQKLDLK
jgi:phosphate transport system substrate-binding protein